MNIESFNQPMSTEQALGYIKQAMTEMIIEMENMRKDLDAIKQLFMPKTIYVSEEMSTQEYEKELLSIKGLGKKTAKDILELYPVRSQLISAIKSNKSLPLRDDIEKLLKEKYLNI
jgi:DNA polymerase/3'-5' exonuclease PolX